MDKHSKIKQIYNKLYAFYGPQGWWPLINHEGQNVYNLGLNEGYHISDYDFPKNDKERFEICLGAILTQNTAFRSVLISLHNLNSIGALNPDVFTLIDQNKIKNAIRPAGFYNQKARYITTFAQFFHSLKGRIPTRQELLNLNGIGPETADSILLYAYHEPQFVIDTYTRRILTALDIITPDYKYGDIKSLMESSLKSVTEDLNEKIIIYQEYHAMLVQHAKIHYSKNATPDNILQPL